MNRALLLSVLSLLGLVPMPLHCQVQFTMQKLGMMPGLKLVNPNDTQYIGSFLYKPELAAGLADPDTFDHDPYGHHCTQIVPKPGGKCCVWLDGVESPLYDQVRHIVKGSFKVKEFKFSPDGRRLAYTARRGEKWRVLVDGKEGPEWDEVTAPFFSGDSKHLCYRGEAGGKWYVQIDEKRYGPYEARDESPVYSTTLTTRSVAYDNAPATFSANGHFGICAFRGKNREMAVIDGKEGPEYNEVHGITLSADGRRCAYVAAKNGKQFVVIDGKPGAKYAEVRWLGLTFSPDGKHLAYAALKPTGTDADLTTVVVADGKESRGYEDVLETSITFSPDGKHLGYVATRNEAQCLVLDGKPGPNFDEVGSYNHYILFSADGRRFAYEATRGEKHYMVIDGKASAAYDDIGGALFSPDGVHVAYPAKIGENWHIVLDGKIGPAYPGIETDSLTFSAAGILAFEAANTEDLHSVVVEKQAREVYESSSAPAFSADGKHLAFIGGKKAENTPRGWQAHLVVDGALSPAFDYCFEAPHFDPDGRLQFLVARQVYEGGNPRWYLYRLTASIGN
ncbi:MAG TPA: hypothetical protein VHR86_10570 [Armatimonadota bacterium]|nr:hypothetical protein [Armatimonadota bacterium]